MTLNEFMFYKTAVEMNKFKFSYGRQADGPLLSLQIPTRDSIPDWVYEIDNEELKKGLPKLQLPTNQLNTNNWEEFEIEELFDIEQGKQLNKADQIEGNIAFIGSSADNNGVTRYIQKVKGYPIFNNVITVSGDGSVGEAFYHSYNIIPTNFMNVLSIKNREMTKNTGVFLCTILKLLRFKYSYGRKLGASKLAKETIKLPSLNGVPNWGWIESYMEEFEV